MQPSSHHPGRLGRTTCALLVTAILLLAAPLSASAGRVFIDPGHGGRFPGAVYGGVTEARINLAIARELDRILRQRGHATRLSRTSDVNVTTRDIRTWNASGSSWRYARDGSFTLRDDLQARCDLANVWGADIFVSVHANAATNTSARGAETYWGNTSTTDSVLSARLASYIQQEYVRETGLSSRGVKVNAFYVLRWSNMPAVLVETGFMSNRTELLKLTDPSFQRKAAMGIAKGIDRFFAENPFPPVYPRIAGADRYETATRIADAGWTGTGGTLILASGAQWPDALTGTPLSRLLDAPIILTCPDFLPEPARQRIDSQSPTRIVVLGGTSAVSTATVNAAVTATGREAATVTVERIHGADRYATAKSIAERVGVPSDGRVYIASGHTYADSLSIAPYAGADRVPILLVQPGSVPEATRRFIADNAGAIKQFQIIGGEVAVGRSVFRELEQTAPAVRIAGADRYETNIAVIRRFSASGALNPVVATAGDFPDALTAGALASRSRRPVILVGGPRYLPGVTREFLLNDSSRIANPTMIGGPNALAYQMDWMIRKSLGR